MYSSYDYDYDRREWLLTFLIDGTELEKYQVLFCFLEFVHCFTFQRFFACRMSPPVFCVLELQSLAELVTENRSVYDSA